MNVEEIRSWLAKFRVGIAGAGGLGSNCAIALARCGVGTIVIADFDSVETANLTRQYYFADQAGSMKTSALKANIHRISETITVIEHQVKLDPSNIVDIFAGCDLIVEAFDSSSMKEMLAETVQLKMPGIPLIMGSGLAGWGNTNAILVRKIDDFLYICGDGVSEVSEDCPPLAPRVGIVANMQADVAIGLLLNKYNH